MGDNSTSTESIRTPSTSSTTTPDPRKKKKKEDFVFGKILGEGSYSTVVLAKEVANEREYAIKILNKQHIIREKKVPQVLFCCIFMDSLIFCVWGVLWGFKRNTANWYSWYSQSNYSTIIKLSIMGRCSPNSSNFSYRRERITCCSLPWIPGVTGPSLPTYFAHSIHWWSLGAWIINRLD